MERRLLKPEFARLRKGRGISRPGLLAAMGPGLREILAIGPDTAEDDARARLLTLLTGESSALPSDLRLLTQAAYGMTSSRPLLSERLAEVASLLERDPRTLRRRLNEADDLLVDRIVQRFASRQTLARPGFHWVTYHIDVDVSGQQPVFVCTRTLVATIDQLSEIGEVVSIPVVGEAESLVVEGLDGCTYEGRDWLSQTSWRLHYRLSRPLGLGETLDTVVRFTWLGREQMQPMAAIVPMRPVERFSVAATFGSPRACAAVWVLNGSVPTSMGDRPGDEDLVEGDPLSVSFDDLLQGHAYGIAWTWA